MTIFRARPAATLVVVAALATAAITTGAAVLTGPAAAAQGCRVDYTPNQWPGGFTANVKVSPGDAAVSSWTVTWTYAGDAAGHQRLERHGQPVRIDGDRPQRVVQRQHPGRRLHRVRRCRARTAPAAARRPGSA